MIRAPRAGPLQTRWLTFSASDLLSHPGAIEQLPAPSIVLIGLAGDLGAELEGHRIRGTRSVDPIPGVLLHALVAEDILTDRVITVGQCL